MFKVISKQKRPNTQVEFWSLKERSSLECLAYIKKNYIDTKKIVEMVSTDSEDGLTRTTETTWAEEKDYLDFQDDSVILKSMIDPFNDYASQNNIIVSSYDEVRNMLVIQGPAPYPNLTVPDTWSDVEEFGDWWIRAGMPLSFPENAEVFLSDDATAICLFRKGRFQVELYLIHPNPKVPIHEHPDVEVIKVRLNGKKYPYLSGTLRNGEAHGAGLRLESEVRGYPLVAIQHWLTREPTTIASMWRGETVGPKQEALIKRFNPDAYIKDGYADTTKKP